jgi:aspartate/tyrosine/aromatic aminotransferase
LAPADPILGLTEAYQQDARPQKINLSVGVYKDEQGTTPVLECVKQAEQRLLCEETTKTYLAIGGLPKYGALVQQMLLGADQTVVEPQRMATIQSPGGTGALRVAADFIRQHFPSATVWCSRPTWENHPKIFQAAGLHVNQYAYLDASGRGLDFPALEAQLRQLPAGDVVVLHACCHNPSGVDPTHEQWARIAELLAARGLLPLMDFAYQGLGTGLDEDAAGLRAVAGAVEEMLIASSFSKNFGLYRERVGALTAVAASQQRAEAVLSQLKICVRTNYSNPPAHGASIVETILGDEGLREGWKRELTAMRTRISGMRALFVETMRAHAPRHDFSFLLSQNGMFSFSGLSPERVDRLREQFAIYVVRSGRINVAGITPQNIDPLCRAVAAVLEEQP